MDYTAVLSDLIQLLKGQFAGGIPTIAIAAAPFVVGIIIGFFLRKALKIALVLIVVAIAGSYFGLVSLSSLGGGAKDLISKYGPMAQTYIGVLFTVVPLSLGLVIGIVIGFLV